MGRACWCGDGGQALPWMLLLMTIGLGMVVVAVRLAPVLDDAAEARTAADAAALAGAAAGKAEAQAVASANNAELVEYHRSGSMVTVVVQVGEVRARASAAATVRWVPI
ncbi:MAG: hypothetical protein P8I99_02770 [Acidimicrobiales bacterium]|nr:hypothetical protein [Acidimicrobiales bacterium]